MTKSLMEVWSPSPFHLMGRPSLPLSSKGSEGDEFALCAQEWVPGSRRQFWISPPGKTEVQDKIFSQVCSCRLQGRYFSGPSKDWAWLRPLCARCTIWGVVSLWQYAPTLSSSLLPPIFFLCYVSPLLQVDPIYISLYRSHTRKWKTSWENRWHARELLTICNYSLKCKMMLELLRHFRHRL